MTQKRKKRLTKIQVLTKDFKSFKIRYVFQKMKVTQLNHSTIESLSLIHNQINFIKFVAELNKFDVYSKICNIFV